MAIANKKSNTSKLKAGNSKKINKWIIAAGVVLVAAVGIIVVRFSSAATDPNTTFVHYSSQISFLWGANQTKTEKINGVATTYKLLNNGSIRGGVATLVSATEAKQSSKVCAHFKVFSTKGIVNIQQVVNGQGKNFGSKSIDSLSYGQTGTVCTVGITNADSTVQVYMSNAQEGNVGVDHMFGRK